MGKKIIIGVVALIAVGIAGFAVVVSTRPSEFHCERSISINASQAAVYGYIQDFHQWAHWSPWEEKDLAMKKIYTGAPQGLGATYEWSGNKDVGAGSMVIDRVDTPNEVHIHLTYTEPFPGSSDATFTLHAADANHTLVTWAMESQQGFPAKAASLFLDMDALIGNDFSRGLARLKQAAETAP